jgi:hypothetical protein
MPGDLVLKWLGKVIGAAATQTDAATPSWLNQLRRVIEPLDALPHGHRAGMARDLLAYVMEGDALKVLQEAGQHKEVTQYLHQQIFSVHHRAAGAALQEFYRNFDSVPTEVALRWAKLLEATSVKWAGARRLPSPNGKHWPDVLLLSSCGRSVQVYFGHEEVPNSPISATAIERLLTADGEDPSTLIVTAFSAGPTFGYGAAVRCKIVRGLAGYAEAVARHLDRVRALVLADGVDSRLHALMMLERAADATLAALAPELAELVVSGSKPVRLAAQPLLQRAGEAADELLRGIAREAKPEQRALALRLLVWLAKQRNQPQLELDARAIAVTDKAPSVNGLIAEWDRRQQPAAEPSADLVYEIPEIDWSGRANLPTAPVLNGLWRALREAVETANRHARERHAAMAARGHKFPLHIFAAFTAADTERLQNYLSADEPLPIAEDPRVTVPWGVQAQDAIKTLAADSGVTAIALLKVLRFFNILRAGDLGLNGHARTAIHLRFRQTGRPSLLELSRMLEPLGVEPRSVLHDYCLTWGSSLADDWPDEAVWPFFAHNLHLVSAALANGQALGHGADRDKLYRAIGMLPSLPPELADVLFDLALGSAKTQRAAAQQALARLPGKETRLVAALDDGKSETRAIAAQWLGRLRCAAAIPALEQAVTKEKNDVAKGAMLDALQAMGQPVEQYLNRDALLLEAQKLLAKGKPQDLAWLPWDQMPTVRWADTAATVPADVLAWMIIQAVKQKQVEPNAILRKYCAMFAERDRERFGQWLLELWLRADVAPITPDEAMRRASAQAQTMHAYMTRSPKLYENHPGFGKSVEDLAAMYLPNLLRTPAGSAIASKGVLAVVAACAAERAAAPTQRYLKEWYGTRASQGKALIIMLGWIEHPSATQLMLAIGSRFRTKSFQEEATRQAELLAERRGWTLAELADRTIPSAGFDEDGVAEFSYGERRFTARLTADLKVELFNPDGKKIAALPEPRADDDADLAKAAKKAYSACKKEIKSVIDLQTDRLYEALCTERDWIAADWQAYLNRHPILRHLTQRLVWLQKIDGVVSTSFRPLSDGSLTDALDNPVELAADARIAIAHESTLPASALAAWQQHLLDYEITPLFQQFGKGQYQLPKDRENADAIKDFEGHLIETFALRGRALKLGYMRGPPADGGWFHTYEKRFATLGLSAVIEFSGNSLPEESRTAALLALYFTHAGSQDSANSSKMELGRIPRVLLAEVYDDLRLLASEGAGYDADWQKKVGY